MTGRCVAIAFLLAALGACGREAPRQPPETRAPAVPAVAPAAEAATRAAPTPATGEAGKSEGGARAVLTAWAHALERGDFDAAYAQWGADAQARSGMEATEHRQWWARFKTITVALQAGQLEGAAGSSFYTAPAAIVGKQRNGKPYRLEGTATLRRVNDVPGASADQLHWHLEKLDLKPVT